MSTTGRDYLRYLWQLLNGFRADGERRIAAAAEIVISFPYVSARKPLQVLDLGNDSLRPHIRPKKSFLICDLLGIHLTNRPRWNSFNLAYTVARSRYLWNLGVPLKDGVKRLICGDVTRLPFLGGSFD